MELTPQQSAEMEQQICEIASDALKRHTDERAQDAIREAEMKAEN